MRWMMVVLMAFLGVVTRSPAQSLPTFTSSLFSGSGNCILCHAYDGDAMTNAGGQDVSPLTDWRSTMMANAFRDPLWMARVEAEMARFPALQAVIEDKCLTCHAPMARTQALFDGATGLTMAEAQGTQIATAGNSCTLCHQIQPSNLGEESSFSGGYGITNARQIFGPYDPVSGGIMSTIANYTPVLGSHLSASELCATCHTLFTPYVDDSGTIVGTFPEQTPYFEWLNSVYAQGAEARSCQRCHMPELAESVLLSSIPSGLPNRSPFSQHHFVGGNALIISLMRDNAVAIGATATTDQFDATRDRALGLLAGGVDLSFEDISGTDTLSVTVGVTNSAGHKFPTGYPSRRAWLCLTATDASGTVIFESGAWTASGEIVGLDPIYEPHRDLITAPDEVQIYETVSGDVNDQVTQTLLRTSHHLKDNRIPPRGYTATGPSAEITAPRGAATSDPNFNRDGGIEGSGRDLVTYQFPLGSAAYPITIDVRLVYQSATPRFIADLLAEDTPAVNAFEAMWAGADNTPITVALESAVILEDVPSGISTR